jgi:hypothetical protein
MAARGQPFKDSRGVGGDTADRENSGVIRAWLAYNECKARL